MPEIAGGGRSIYQHTGTTLPVQSQNSLLRLFISSAYRGDKSNNRLDVVNRQAKELFSRPVKQTAEAEGVTERSKSVAIA